MVCGRGVLGVLDDGSGMSEGLAIATGALDGEEGLALWTGEFGPSCGSRPETHLIQYPPTATLR